MSKRQCETEQDFALGYIEKVVGNSRRMELHVAINFTKIVISFLAYI